MALPKKYDFNDYDNYLTDANPTTSAEAQDYFRNTDSLVGALVDAFLWQPETNYANGDVVKSDSMPNGAEAVCVSTNGGKSSNVEPQWGSVGGENIADGTCFWKLRWEHWSKSIATQAEAKEGIVTDKTVTPFLAGITAKTRVNIGMDNIVSYSGVSKSEFTWAVIQSVLKQKAIDFGMPVVTTSEWVGGDVYPLLEKPPYHGYMSIKCYANGTMIMTYRAHSIGVNKEYIASYLDGTLSGWKELASVDMLPVDTLPVGAILPYAGNTSSLPNGFLFCDGSAISRTTYKELFSKIGTNYGVGDGSTTFNVPNLENNSFMEFQAERGVVKSAGLPNITGAFTNCMGSDAGADGAFYYNPPWTSGQGAGNGQRTTMRFDASRSSSIYGNSTTVQPKSVTVRAIIKYA